MTRQSRTAFSPSTAAHLKYPASILSSVFEEKKVFPGFRHCRSVHYFHFQLDISGDPLSALSVRSSTSDVRSLKPSAMNHTTTLPLSRWYLPSRPYRCLSTIQPETISLTLAQSPSRLRCQACLRRSRPTLQKQRDQRYTENYSS